MKKLLVGAAAASFAVIIMGCGSVYAALQCISQPSCASLGYSTTDVEGCDSYVYCPFDTSYKACIPSCTGYDLTECPEDANCSMCGIGTTIKYKRLFLCQGYTLEACIPNALTCSTCEEGNSVKYKVDMCQDGYAAIIGSSRHKPIVECRSMCPGYDFRYGALCYIDDSLSVRCSDSKFVGFEGYEEQACKIQERDNFTSYLYKYTCPEGFYLEKANSQTEENRYLGKETFEAQCLPNPCEGYNADSCDAPASTCSECISGAKKVTIQSSAGYVFEYVPNVKYKHETCVPGAEKGKDGVCRYKDSGSCGGYVGVVLAHQPKYLTDFLADNKSWISQTVSFYYSTRNAHLAAKYAKSKGMTGTYCVLYAGSDNVTTPDGKIGCGAAYAVVKSNTGGWSLCVEKYEDYGGVEGEYFIID